MLTRLAAILIIIAPTMLLAQEPAKERPALELPDCDIFLFELEETADAVTLAGDGENITDRPGYDNQPWFTPSSKSILYSANGAPDRTDIYEYFIESQQTKQVTDTPTQEYSPQISPDNQTLSFVTDGETANQSIWFTQRESDKEEWLLGNQGEREPVGYYSWNHKTGYILFWSRYGFSLRLVHRTKKLSHYVTGDATPTTPYIIPGTNKFSFMHRQGNSEVWIKELDPETKAIRPITRIVGNNNNNYGWTPGGRILMIDGAKLHAFSPKNADKGWTPVADLSELGIESATRVAVSPNGKHLAIVGLPKENPAR